MFRGQKQTVAGVLVCFFLFTPVFAYDYDANDFAFEVVDYDSTNAGDYDDPSSALGGPSVDVNYYGVDRPLVPVIQAEGYDQVVTIGLGGYLIVKFNHKVADDRNNPFGVDFIVFGNSFLIIGDEESWGYGEPNDTIISGDSRGNYLIPDPAVVSVSQDGITWYSFDSGPYGDDFAPTMGRIYNPNNPLGDYGSWDNQWWGELTDPTLPLDPNIIASDFNGRNVSYMAQVYGESAGGAGFDLRDLALEDYEALRIDPNSGRRWIQYVMFESKDTYNIENPEVDAVADAAGCGDYKHPFPAGDSNRDCKVDFLDFAIMSTNWLDCTWNCD